MHPHRHHNRDSRKEFFSRSPRGNDYPVADVPADGYAGEFEQEREFGREPFARYPQFRGNSAHDLPQREAPNARHFFEHHSHSNDGSGELPNSMAAYENAKEVYENAKAQFDEASTKYAQYINSGRFDNSAVPQSSGMPAMVQNQATMPNQMPAMMPNQVDAFGRYMPDAPGNPQAMMPNNQMLPDARVRQPSLYGGNMLLRQQGVPLYEQGRFSPMQGNGELARSDP